jgi:hypothetical protein
MLRRLLVLITLSWGIIVLPSLCRAGVLAHPCECGVSSDCGHEESCTSDPCTLAKPKTETGDVHPLASPLAVTAVLPCFAPRLPAAPALDPRSISVTPALKTGARPLLI